MRTLLRIACVALVSVISPPLPGSEHPRGGTLPVVGSTAGAFGSNFRTELQLNNRSSRVMQGTLAFRRAGSDGGEVGLSISYEIEPHATLRFDDVVAEMGGDGIGSLDLLVEQGGIPTVVARAFDDQGEEGTAGATIPLVRADRLLQTGERAVIIAPADLAQTRFNMGVRSFDDGAEIRFTVIGSNGIERSSATRSFGANHFTQSAGADLVGVTLMSNEAIEIEIVAGSALVYGTTTDNQTNDPSIQLAIRLEDETGQ